MGNFRFLVRVNAHEFLLDIRRSYDKIIHLEDGTSYPFVPPSLLFLRGVAESPSLVLVINDTKLLMLCV